MKNVKRFLIGIGLIILVYLVATIINILQNGIGGYKGQSMEAILGVPPENASLEDIRKLTKPQVMQLFYASPTPDFISMNGEYRSYLLPLGILAYSASCYTHHFFGPGHWEGKAFILFEDAKGWGYNIFSVKRDMARTRKFNTYIGPSTIDSRPSFHLDYSPFNKGFVHSMRDELRKINDNLFLCMGHMGIGGGSINPAPFVLMGPPSPWVGLGQEE